MNSERQYIDGRHLALCFQVHQPKRLVQQPTTGNTLTDDKADKEIFQRIAQQCYLPANALLLRLIEQYPTIKISFAISGLALEQMKAYSPETLESFKKLADTGSVDFIAEPYYHSLAFLLDSDEFEIQTLKHVEKIVEHFGIRPSVFKNANLIYNDEIGRRIAMLGFQGVITEGCERSLRQNRPQNLYEHPDSNGLQIFTRNQNLSDDIAFGVTNGFSNVTADKFMSWLEQMPEQENLVTLCVDYETFGEHNKAESGVFAFLEQLLLILAIQNTYKMITPAEVVERYQAHRHLSIPDHISIGGIDLFGLIGNDRQREALGAMVALENPVKRNADPELISLWQQLQSSDHFYYMSDNAGNPDSLSPFSTPQQAFENYMAIVQFINQKINSPVLKGDTEKHNEVMEAERRNIATPVWALNLGSHADPVT